MLHSLTLSSLAAILSQWALVMCSVLNKAGPWARTPWKSARAHWKATLRVRWARENFGVLHIIGSAKFTLCINAQSMHPHVDKSVEFFMHRYIFKTCCPSCANKVIKVVQKELACVLFIYHKKNAYLFCGIYKQAVTEVQNYEVVARCKQLTGHSLPYTFPCASIDVCMYSAQMSMWVT